MFYFRAYLMAGGVVAAVLILAIGAGWLAWVLAA
jgi:hypothetical protein